MNNNNIFRMYDCCRIVCGVKRAAIYDLQRGSFETIPLSMADVLTNSVGRTLDAIHNYCNNKEQKRIINSYFDFLVRKEYGFWCENLREFNMFPNSSVEWGYAI
jgi:hypothetical protein